MRQNAQNWLQIFKIFLGENPPTPSLKGSALVGLRCYVTPQEFFFIYPPPEQISGYGPAVGARKLVAQDWCGAKITEKKFGAEIRRRKNELSI